MSAALAAIERECLIAAIGFDELSSNSPARASVATVEPVLGGGVDLPTAPSPHKGEGAFLGSRDFLALQGRDPSPVQLVTFSARRFVRLPGQRLAFRHSMRRFGRQ